MTPPDRTDALVDALVQTSFTVVTLLNRIGAENDLSLTQLRLLAILRDRTPPMSALAAHLGLERSTMSGLVDRAERRGLVVRRPDPGDGRTVLVALTDAGSALARDGHRRIADAMAPTFAHLASAEQQRLAQLLERMLGPG